MRRHAARRALRPAPSPCTAARPAGLARPTRRSRTERRSLGWAELFDHYALRLKTAVFLGATDKLQREDSVVHLVAQALSEPQVERQAGRRGQSGFLLSGGADAPPRR
jgi:hypothetical protein